MASGKILCWNCKAPVDDPHFCGGCRKIQPSPRGIDFFAFLGLPRKLNVDLKNLERRFYELSRKFHPDFYQKESAREREISTEKTSLLNKAYGTLRDPWSRAEYAAGLAGLDAQKKANAVPPELLDEVMAIQEEISQHRNGRQASALLQKSLQSLKDRLAELSEKMADCFQEWDRAADPRSVAEKMVGLLHEKKYLETALRNAENVLSEISAKVRPPS